MGMGIYGIGQ
ncbi:rCG31078, partial [Rattus norvegicus]